MVSDGKNRTEGLLSGQKMLGYKVENPRGEGLGRIEDIMIGAEGGQVAYAVVSFGGVLSLGTKLFAFPWSALHVDRSKKKVILNLDRKTLATSRGFEKDRWPDANDWNWSAPIPQPIPLATATPERAALIETPAVRVEAPPQDAPPLRESPVMDVAASSIEHWGKSWQAHGLDRS